MHRRCGTRSRYVAPEPKRTDTAQMALVEQETCAILAGMCPCMMEQCIQRTFRAEQNARRQRAQLQGWMERFFFAQDTGKSKSTRKEVRKHRAELPQQRCMLSLDKDVGELLRFKEDGTVEVGRGRKQGSVSSLPQTCDSVQRTKA